MKRRTLLLVVLAGLICAPGLGSAAPNPPVAPPCSPLSGTFIFTLFAFTGPTTAVGAGSVESEGQALGSFSANYFDIEPRGQGVTHLSGQHAVSLPGGTLLTSDAILLQADNQNPAVMRANSRVYIVGGTGVYEGASGLLHTHGKLNVVTLEGGIDFKGQLCVP